MIGEKRNGSTTQRMVWEEEKSKYNTDHCRIGRERIFGEKRDGNITQQMVVEKRDGNITQRMLEEKEWWKYYIENGRRGREMEI